MADITKHQVEVYKLRNLQYEEWADITIDENKESRGGRISISSGHGNWAYYWGSPGGGFKQFLTEIGIDYVATKFGESNYFDSNATFKMWKKDILTSRKDEDLTAEQARALYDEVKEVSSEVNTVDHLVSKVMYEGRGLYDFFGGVPETITTISPSFQGFWNKVWVVFVEELKKEISSQPAQLQSA